ATVAHAAGHAPPPSCQDNGRQAPGRSRAPTGRTWDRVRDAATDASWRRPLAAARGARTHWWDIGPPPGGTRGRPGPCPRSGSSTPPDSTAPPPAPAAWARARTSGAAGTPTHAYNRRCETAGARAPARRRAATPASASAPDHTPRGRPRRSSRVGSSSSRLLLRFRGGGRRRVGLPQRVDLLVRPLRQGVP